MQAFMLKLDRVLRRHRVVVLLLWVAAIAVAVPFAAKQSDHLTGGGFGVPGSQSQAVEDRLDRDFPEASRASVAVVLRPAKDATPADVRKALQRVDAVAKDVKDVELATATRRKVAAQAQQQGASKPIVVPLTASVPDRDATDVAHDLRTQLGIDRKPGTAAGGAVRLHVVGQGALWAALQDVAKHDVQAAEQRGFPIVALILLAVFGSLVAAALPLALGLASVIVTGALIYVLSLTMEMSVFVTNMASMVGIGVAVDYSLFVLARYREEVRGGRAPDEARAAALATSGVAVLFSGLTVIASLAGLFLVNTTALRSMAIGAIVVVTIAMLAASTLLPVLISLMGKRAWAPSGIVGSILTRRRTRAHRPAHATFWGRWTAVVMRRPKTALLVSAALLLALAAPALNLETENGALRQLGDDHELQQGFAAAAAVSPKGSGAPVKVLAAPESGTVRDPENAAALDRLRRRIARDRAIADVRPPVPAENGRAALLLATLDTDGESKRAAAAVDRLRTVESERLELQVGGTTATLNDFEELVSGSMWKIMLFVLALSYVVLLVLLRSAILPLKAVVMNILSVGAAYGVLTLVFGEVDTIVPPLVLAVVFGLSMDYEVFLLTRIRERYLATGDTQRAVAEGLATSARTITSAALIMVAVFLVFVLTGLPSIQQIGLGNAVAIAVDATLVRLVLVPSAMELLGKWNWWLPKPLERVLPEASFEELEPATTRTASAA